ncbi:MAG: glucose-1-phosphate adenylyltransferase [Anaerolineae bacterium]|nr:MAG: glucose-1-phosphate adenylyltransferase [Anaerolineae bacterium]
MRHVLGVILGGGRGTRLYPLTKLRAKPAVPLAGKYRLIDVPISNCLNSGVTRIYVLTQFLSASLHRHIYQTYKFDTFGGGWVQILAAVQTYDSEAGGSDWFQGTADAVRKQLSHIRSARISEVLILSGDHLYRMDYRLFIAAHREHGADVTVAVQAVTREAASGLGILKMDVSGRIVEFAEKLKGKALDKMASPESNRRGSGDDSEKPFLASMGIYVFNLDVLQDLLETHNKDDFGLHILPAAIKSHQVYAYPFAGYWEDIGTVRAYYEASLSLALPDPPFDLYDPERPIYSRPRYLPGTRTDDCHLERVMLADGCLLQDAVISDSVIGLRSIVGPGVRISRSVIMGADFYEDDARRAANRQAGIPDVGIGSGSSIEGAIVDKNTRIGRNVVIRPHPEVTDMVEEDNHVIRDGLVIVPKNAVIPDGTII